MQNIKTKVVNGYNKIENLTVSTYKKVEKTFVNGFEKICDKCIETFFTKSGETVYDAKIRLSNNK